MNNQQGAALVIVMALLSGALILGFSGMQSALIEERLAGNYRLHTQANMNTESIGAAYLAKHTENIQGVSGPKDPSAVNSEVFAECSDYHYDALLAQEDLFPGACQTYLEEADDYDGVACHLLVTNTMCGLDNGHYIAVIGTVGHHDTNKLAEGISLFISLSTSSSQEDESDIPPPFLNPMEVCSDINLTGSATITGSIFSGGNVTFGGGSKPAEMVEAAGKIISPGNWWETQHADFYDNYKQNLGSDYTTPCDPLSVGTLWDNTSNFTSSDKAQDVNIGGWPKVNAWIDHDGLWVWNQQENAPERLGNYYANQTLSGIQGFPDEHEFVVMQTGDLVQRNGEIVVGGNRDYLLIVDGDLTLGAGGHRSLVIENGSTLTIISSGDVSLNASLKMQDTPLLTNGRPTFSLYNANPEGRNNQKVDMLGEAAFTGNLYAPESTINVKGSSKIRGTLKAQSLNMQGAATLTSEANGNVASPGDGEGSSDGSVGGNTGEKWILL